MAARSKTSKDCGSPRILRNNKMKVVTPFPLAVECIWQASGAALAITFKGNYFPIPYKHSIVTSKHTRMFQPHIGRPSSFWLGMAPVFHSLNCLVPSLPRLAKNAILSEAADLHISYFQPIEWQVTFVGGSRHLPSLRLAVV